MKSKLLKIASLSLFAIACAFTAHSATDLISVYNSSPDYDLNTDLSDYRLVTSHDGINTYQNVKDVTDGIDSTASSDSVTVKCAFVYDTTKVSGRKLYTPVAVQFVNGSSLKSFRYNNNDTLTLRIPKGTYDISSAFTIQLEARALNHGCVWANIINEDVVFNNDTLVEIKFADAKNHIHFEKYLPNGEKCSYGTHNFIDNTTSPDKNVDYQGYFRYIIKKGFGSVDNCRGYTVGVIVLKDSSIIDARNNFDFLISDVSENYKLVTLYYTYGKEPNSIGDPVLIRFEQNGVNKSDTISNDWKNYFIKEENFRTSPVGLNAKYHSSGYRFSISNLAPDDYRNANIFSSTGYTSKKISDGEPAKLYICEPTNLSFNDQTQVLYGVTYRDYSYYKMGTSGKDSTEVSYWTSSPWFQIQKDKKVMYINNGIPTLSKDPITKKSFDLPGHPAFSYPEKLAQIKIGNSCPINAFVARNYINASRVKQSIFYCTYLGQRGETRTSDLYNLKMEIRYNDSIVCSDYSKMATFLSSWAKAKHPDGVFNAVFTNNNVKVDTVAGKNITKITFDQRKSDWTPPTLQMLQMRNLNDSTITNQFKSPEDGSVEFAGGDFSYVSTGSYYDCQPMNAKVYYSQNGKDEWTELKATEDPAFYNYPAFGYFYHCPLNMVNVKSENCWYDLMIELTDTAGNTQTQILSPAFKISQTTSVSDIKSEISPCKAIVSGRTLYITNADGATAKLYSTTGQCVGVYNDATQPISINNLTCGIYIVEINKCGVRKVMKIRVL
jgi:hypothetical protein